MKKVIIITGGSEGLGKEIARKLSAEHQVVILATNEDKLKATATEVGCDYLICDVTKYDQIEKSINEVIAKYQKVDVLINNAGIWIEGEIDSNDPEQIRKVLEVNTLGTIWFTRAVVPTMKKQKSGLIVNVVSQTGYKAKEKRSVYAASKFAISGLTDSLNVELAPYNIGVCGIYPYKIDTKMFEKSGVNKDMSDALDPAQVAKTVAFMVEMEYPTLLEKVVIKNNSYKNKV